MTATIRVSALRGFGELVTSLRGTPEILARDCGISPEIIDDEDALIPFRQLIHLLEHSASELNVPDFGLRLGASQDIGVLGALAVAMQNSTTVEEATYCAAAHLFMHSSALRFEIEPLGEQTCCRLYIQLNNMPQSSMRQTIDLTASVSHQNFIVLAGNNYELRRIELPHHPICSPAVYEKYFGAEVAFGCKDNAAYISTSTMKTPLGKRSDHLHRLATEFLNVQYPSPDGRISGRVETAIRRTLGTDSCNRDTVARAMAIHPRTLQRRLKKEGESFDNILERVRREKASYYLLQTGAPLSQVASALGYSEQSAFSRSFRRWFGQPPLAFRNSRNSITENQT